MKKIHKFCVKCWRHILLVAPALIILFFLWGAGTEYSHIRGLENQILQHPELHPTQCNDIWMMVYNGFDTETVLYYTFMTGVGWAVAYSALTLHVLFLVTMLTSDKAEHNTVGIVFGVLTAIVVLGYLWFAANFHLTF